MAEYIFFDSNDSKIQVIIVYPPGGDNQRAEDILLTNLEPSWGLSLQIFPGGSPNPHEETVLAGTNRRSSTLPPGLLQQIRIDDTNPEEIVVFGFGLRTIAQRLRIEGGYGK